MCESSESPADSQHGLRSRNLPNVLEYRASPFRPPNLVQQSSSSQQAHRRVRELKPTQSPRIQASLNNNGSAPGAPQSSRPQANNNFATFNLNIRLPSSRPASPQSEFSQTRKRKHLSSALTQQRGPAKALSRTEGPHEEFYALLARAPQHTAKTALQLVQGGADVVDVLQVVKAHDPGRERSISLAPCGTYDFPFITGLPMSLRAPDNPYAISLLFKEVFGSTRIPGESHPSPSNIPTASAYTIPYHGCQIAESRISSL